MDLPEINIAKRLVEKKVLEPPIDIFALAKKYASIRLMDIPFEIDGISINIKVPGRYPLIILNSSVHSTRMRFTLAHELGHILIPWHMGTIIDNTEEKYGTNNIYWVIESEANRFASELLMPSEWIKTIIKKRRSIEDTLDEIIDTADVSSPAAAISLIRSLETGYVFAMTNKDNEVILSGRSRGTLAVAPTLHAKIDSMKHFPFCKNFHQFEISGNSFLWWKFDDDVDLKKRRLDRRDWREILDRIVGDIGIPAIKIEKFKMSLNGVIASANANVRGDNRTVKAIYSACLQRIYSKPDLSLFVSHRDFDNFLIKRVKDLFDRRNH